LKAIDPYLVMDESDISSIQKELELTKISKCNVIFIV